MFWAKYVAINQYISSVNTKQSFFCTHLTFDLPLNSQKQNPSACSPIIISKLLQKKKKEKKKKKTKKKQKKKQQQTTTTTTTTNNKKKKQKNSKQNKTKQKTKQKKKKNSFYSEMPPESTFCLVIHGRLTFKKKAK